jgi:hypothetical protein
MLHTGTFYTSFYRQSLTEGRMSIVVSFENRTRLLFEVIKAIRNVIPADTSFLLRMSSAESMEDTELGKELGS